MYFTLVWYIRYFQKNGKMDKQKWTFIPFPCSLFKTECADRCRIVVWRQQRCTVALPGGIKDSAVTTRLVLYAGSRARPSHKPRNGGNFTSEATVTYSLRVRAGGCTVNVRNAWLTGRQSDEKTASQSMRRSYQRPPRISAGARVLLMSGQ